MSSSCENSPGHTYSCKSHQSSHRSYAAFIACSRGRFRLCRRVYRLICFWCDFFTCSNNIAVYSYILSCVVYYNNSFRNCDYCVSWNHIKFNRISFLEALYSLVNCRLVYFDKGSISGSFLSFSDGTKLKATAMDKPESEIGSAVNVMPTVTVITDDFEAVAGSIVEKAEYHTIQWVYGYDTALSGDKEISYCEDLENAFAEMGDEGQGFSAYCESRIDREDDFYGMYGSLFFLGSMLSIVFIVAAVLIIYYKQVSEGYEDQSRFDIMQKVGMTARDIRKSINSQLLTVFFLPLCIAAIHLAFAFPLLNKMLMLFGLMDVRLLIVTTAISILVFALFYVVVYRITSNAYYKIVSGR